nr:MAG TPA: hypothetical protein [Caudoviricetes sp.]
MPLLKSWLANLADSNCVLLVSPAQIRRVYFCLKKMNRKDLIKNES